ncbi:MAG: hypothetical protein ABJA82_10545 [Myxococcales bacterium]
MNATIARVGVIAGCLSACSARGSSNTPDAMMGTDSAVPTTDGADGGIEAPSTPDAYVLPQSVCGAQISVDGSGLSALPPLTNVCPIEREDSVGIDFDPFNGAQDYRVYALPAPGDITDNPDGTTTIHNAIYRCAGTRQTWDLETNLNMNAPNLTAANSPYNWRADIGTDPVVGFVYATPGDHRVPVYAIATTPSTLEHGWRESRTKIYTTDSHRRQMLVAQGGRDDGIVFYVPAAANAATHTVYESANPQGPHGAEQWYFGAADMATRATDPVPPTPAFEVLAAPGADTVKLYKVTYRNDTVHIELAAGDEHFQRTAYQGNGPLWHVEWAGLTQPTTLVVEALATGCPYQGFLSGQHLDAPPHQTFYTLGELQARAATGEVFINGQHDTTMVPRAIARSFIRVTPHPHAATDWDWYQGFGDNAALAQTTQIPWADCPAGDQQCGRWQSSQLDFTGFNLDDPSGVRTFTYGAQLGQLWVAFDDTGQDVTGKLRFTARQTATMSSDASRYLHVGWSVNVVGTDRRYPQMIVSDQPAPVQSGFVNPAQNSLLVQTIDGPSMRLEIQAIHGLVGSTATGSGPWDVNRQAPNHVMVSGSNFSDAATQGNPPAEPIFEHAGMDRMTRFDAFVSSQRVYVFMDGTPAGCSLFPSDFTLGGNVTVTFGDVLYHEGAQDELVCHDARPYSFMHSHQCTETSRHFDDLGFKSGVSAPLWDETRFPCTAY